MMIKSGRTPLLRARNIEQKLGVKRIYIKLEGANPSGSKKDRFAEKIILLAKSTGKQHVIADGSKPFLYALAYYAEVYGVMTTVLQFNNQKWKSKLVNSFTSLDKIKSNEPKSIDGYQSFKHNEETLRIIEGIDESSLAELSYMEIIEEINNKMKNSMNHLFYAHSKDYQNSIQNGLLIHYLRHLDNMPIVHHINHPGEENINDDMIDRAYRLLTKEEHLKVKRQDVLPFAHFLKLLDLGDIDKGHHVIILDRAKTRVDVKRLFDFNEVSKKQLLSYIDHYLDQYSDPKIGAEDALDNAINKGFVLIASSNSKVDGVCVIVNMGFDHFIPTYHLAYIGTNPESKGRGLGTELINYAIDLTDGVLSLHVDLDNSRAKKLYEKMGFRHAYNRMIYHGEE